MKKRAFARKAAKVTGIEWWNMGSFLCPKEISIPKVLYNTQADSRRPACIKLIVINTVRVHTVATGINNTTFCVVPGKHSEAGCIRF